MTRDKQHNKQQSIENTLSTLDDVRDAVAVIAGIRRKLEQLLEPQTDEEARLTLHHLDMSIVQLDFLAVHIASRVRG